MPNSIKSFFFYPFLLAVGIVLEEAGASPLVVVILVHAFHRCLGLRTTGVHVLRLGLGVILLVEFLELRITGRDVFMALARAAWDAGRRRR